MKRLLVFYMAFILLFFGGAMVAAKFINLDMVQALGIGTVGGVIVAEFRTIISKVVGS